MVISASFLLFLLTSVYSLKHAIHRRIQKTLKSSSLEDICEIHPHCVRLFHPAFPLKVLEPITVNDAKNVVKLQELLGKDPIPSKYLSSLPWKPLPAVKISSNEKEIWSKTEIAEAFEKFKHTGHLIWAHKIKTPEKGCFLLNHWQQKVIYIAEYDSEKGAKGFEIHNIDSYRADKTVTWPPLALEEEMFYGQWQPVRVSDNLVSGEVLSYFSPQMPKALWELIFLLLLSPVEDKEALQALFDTGLSARQGFIAYLRLLQSVQVRTIEMEGIPSYRQITENELRI